jgi:hypothetical protein
MVKINSTAIYYKLGLLKNTVLEPENELLGSKTELFADEIGTVTFSRRFLLKDFFITPIFLQIIF